MKFLEQAGRTVDDALALALERLGVGRDLVDVEILDEGARGFLGLGSRDAVVRVSARPDKAELVREFIEDLIGKMGYSCTVQVSQDDDSITASLDGERAGLLIGRHGQTVNALQYLVSVVAGRACDDRRRVVVDVAGYRRKRERSLETLARRMASRARRLGQPVRLDVMPASERRLVHLALKDMPGVSTGSEGQEPHRRVVINPLR